MKCLRLDFCQLLFALLTWRIMKSVIDSRLSYPFWRSGLVLEEEGIKERRESWGAELIGKYTTRSSLVSHGSLIRIFRILFNSLDLL